MNKPLDYWDNRALNLQPIKAVLMDVPEYINKVADIFEKGIIYPEMDLRGRGLILDCGCGIGRHLWECKNREYEVVGVDFSIEMLKLAKNRVDAPLINCDATKLPFQNCSYDAVLAVAMLYHVPSFDAKKTILEEFFRVLKEDGTLVLTISTDDLGFKIRKILVGDTGINILREDGYYCGTVSYAEFRGILMNLGVREIKTYGNPAFSTFLLLREFIFKIGKSLYKIKGGGLGLVHGKMSIDNPSDISVQNVKKLISAFDEMGKIAMPFVVWFDKNFGKYFMRFGWNLILICSRNPRGAQNDIQRIVG
ncbi:MAG: class I SAM-dependent methyltransferase [Candidatus Thermoplasmatota archaeon]